MGLRCVCPQGHVLNIKPELAGKQGICPKCGTEFTIKKNVAEQDQSTQAVPAVPEAVEWRLANPEGEQFGPTVPTLFAQWIAQGRVPADWLVWRTGWSEWRRADEAEADLPAPLPPRMPSETPPPLGMSALSQSTQPQSTQPQSTRSNQTSDVSRSAPVNEYTLRRQRAVKRQRFIIAVLGVVTLTLIGLLIWIALK